MYIFIAYAFIKYDFFVTIGLKWVNARRIDKGNACKHVMQSLLFNYAIEGLGKIQNSGT